MKLSNWTHLGHNFIDGNWQQGGGSAFTKQDPVSAQVIYTGYESCAQDVDKACVAAGNAFKNWAKTSLDERIALVQKFAQIVKDNKEAMATIISQETSKPLWETRTEVDAMIAKVAISIRAYHERTGSSISEDGSSALCHRPHGVLAVFGPYNFPAHLPNGHIVPALIAGNTIVFKPSEITPKTAEFTIALWERAGLPQGVINLMQGGRKTGAALANHERIDGLLFTGSAGTGYHLSKTLATTPHKILALEMGGNNALIIDEVGESEEDVKAVVNIAIQSAFISSGQRCTCARRILIKNGANFDKFIQAFVKAADNLVVGAYDSTPTPFMGGVASLEAAKNMLKAQATLQQLGAKSLLTMHQPNPNSSILTPAILEVTGTQMPDEEYFGPLTTIRRYDDFEEAIALANKTRFGLSCGLVSPKRELFEQLLIEARAGIINWNKPTTGAASSAPFGGVGASGNHRPSAYYAADYCAYPVASMLSTKAQLPEILPEGMVL